jgi:transposase
LEARLAKDSHNSSKPPSSDPPFKKPAPRSLRRSSGKRPGGQKGHPGATLGLVDEPDRTVTLALTGHCDCGRCRAGILASPLPERRQVTELVIGREVTEYRIVEGVCACGQVHREPHFRRGLRLAVQYGPGVYALAVHMTQYQFLPYQRTAELFDELAGIAISPATVHAAVRSAARRVQPEVAAIGQALVRAAVAHADETGVRVGGKLNWLHVLSTDTRQRLLCPPQARPSRPEGVRPAGGLRWHPGP